MKHKILIVDDDKASCRTLQLHFSSQGYLVTTAHDVQQGLSLAAEEQPCLIILDIRMPGRSGLEGLPDFKEISAESRIIMITAFHDMESTIRAMQGGADEYIHKPIDIDELDHSVNQLILSKNRDHNSELQTVKDRVERKRRTMVGRSRAMKEVFKTIGLVAGSPVTVLITGESGTGKELVARALHQSGEHSQGPFVAVNCAALVENLLESELFGHEKGSFTGAVNRQEGKFAIARGGTIFLDEVGDMSPAMQAKLLRVLQDREFVPVGGNGTETTDARVIAATNLDLESRVQNRQFREDLFYRLQVVNVHLPPLRERREDIIDLVQALLARINHEMQRSVTSISMDAIEMLTRYEWPGNVRELENVLMKAVVLSSGNVITPELLPEKFLALSRSKEPSDFRHQESTVGINQLSLEEVEKRHTLQVLQSNHWHRGRVCEILGVSRPRLRRMMKQYGIEPPENVDNSDDDHE